MPRSEQERVTNPVRYVREKGIKVIFAADAAAVTTAAIGYITKNPDIAFAGGAAMGVMLPTNWINFAPELAGKAVKKIESKFTRRK